MDLADEAMHFTKTMPANIALIKYIGKEEGNIPLNPTLSFALPELITTAHLTYSPSLAKDCWKMDPKAPKLAYKSIERYLQHLKRVKEVYNFCGNFSVFAYNNFPMGTGLASSASSFSALTECALDAIYTVEKIQQKHQLSVHKKAMLSRMGSGSSARSFFGPWAIGDGDSMCEASFGNYDNLQHVVLILSAEQKRITSSQAHQLVRTSPVFLERQKNVQERHNQLYDALEKNRWHDAYKLTWEDFIEMHRMFHTAKPRFSYCNQKVTKILEHLQTWWQWHDDGPIVTMDAGPNIHLLFRADQTSMKNHLLKQLGNIKYLVGRHVKSAEAEVSSA